MNLLGLGIIIGFSFERHIPKYHDLYSHTLVMTCKLLWFIMIPLATSLQCLASKLKGISYLLIRTYILISNFHGYI
jgi:hypothetical protein